MDANFSSKVKDVISYSKEEALRLGHDYIGVEHLLLGIIREGNGLAVKILESLGINSKDLRAQIELSTKAGSGIPSQLLNIPLVKQAENVLKITYLEAKLFKSNVTFMPVDNCIFNMSNVMHTQPGLRASQLPLKIKL